VVLKVASGDVLHKSDAGAIKVGIRDKEELKAALQELRGNVRRQVPDARIDGFLVEKMAPTGQEVIIGMKRDPSFGPLMMFGLGGIFVELFRDVSFRVAPLNRHDVLHMVKETKSYTLLNGFRGEQKYDLGAILDNLVRLGRLAADHKIIQEIEINPLLVLPEGQGALALDCRMILN
jgi:succinyl-CoA synthetase beta subunit